LPFISSKVHGSVMSAQDQSIKLQGQMNFEISVAWLIAAQDIDEEAAGTAEDTDLRLMGDIKFAVYRISCSSLKVSERFGSGVGFHAKLRKLSP
jgi:hypothetical protein